MARAGDPEYYGVVSSSAIWPLTVPAAVERIQRRDPVIHAYVTTRRESALAESRATAPPSPDAPLRGVPYGLKDSWDTLGIVTTGGSYRHRDRLPERSSPVFDVFRSAGAVLVGKTSLSDMALAPEASNFIVGATRNPIDLSRTAGGSSGGAAAAVADGMQSFDWGTDIGGSVRMPAAFCGVLGMRLSSETWPLHGLFPRLPGSLAWMCGQGPLTKTIEQMRAVLSVAAPTMRTGPPRHFALRGAVLQLPDQPGKWPTFAAEAAPHVRVALEGLPLHEQPLPSTTSVRNIYSSLWASHFEELLASEETLSFSEGLRAVLSSILFRGVFGDRRFHPATAELLALIALGHFTLFRDPAEALRKAATIRESFDGLWSKGYVIVAPVCAYPAPRLGRLNWNPHILSCTVSGNVADATSISIPFGRFADGLPRGLQIMGPAGSEDVVLDCAERLMLSRDRDPTLTPAPAPS